MHNQTILIGRIANEPQIFDTKEKTKSIITLAIQRGTKNSEGIYETDFIPCLLINSIAENVFTYCKKGDLVGVKGRIESNENGLQIIAEKVTFLSSRKVKEEE